ncbi:MAG: phosphoribosyltransferase [bacterium]|nr:phosphoribosyltransferase [bacterium]
MESVYIPKIVQCMPGYIEGGTLFKKDSNLFDLRVSLVNAHPSTEKNVECFDGYSATVLLHPKTDLKRFANLSPEERNEFRNGSEYAGICASLAMMPWPNTDIALVVDHAGELVSRFVYTMRELVVAEAKREKIKEQDGSVSVKKVNFSENIDFTNKDVYILDEFIGSGYTLRIIIDEVRRRGGRVNGIGVIATIDKQVKCLAEHPYNMIPIRTLIGDIGKE